MVLVGRAVVLEEIDAEPGKSIEHQICGQNRFLIISDHRFVGRTEKYELQLKWGIFVSFYCRDITLCSHGSYARSDLQLVTIVASVAHTFPAPTSAQPSPEPRHCLGVQHLVVEQAREALAGAEAAVAVEPVFQPLVVDPGPGRQLSRGQQYVSAFRTRKRIPNFDRIAHVCAACRVPTLK